MTERRARYTTKLHTPRPAGIPSTLEAELMGYIHIMGWPEPKREYKFHPKRRYKADFAWPELRLLVEVEGGQYTNGRHYRPQGYEADCEKYNLAALEGWTVLRFTTSMIHDGRAISTIEDFLKGRY